MSLSKVMLDCEGQVLSPDDVRKLITGFNNSYIDATKKIIVESRRLDQEGDAGVHHRLHQPGYRWYARDAGILQSHPLDEE